MRNQERFSHGKQLDVLLKQNVITGATMAFRVGLRNFFSPIPKNWVHDAWIASIASAMGAKGDFIDECLIFYRQHEKQQIGGMKIGVVENIRRTKTRNIHSYFEKYRRFLDLRERLVELDILDEPSNIILQEKIVHLENRRRIYERPGMSAFLALSELASGRYHRFSRGFRDLVIDIIF